VAIQTFHTPVGKLHLVASPKGLRVLSFRKPKISDNTFSVAEESRAQRILDESENLLQRYFEGDIAAVEKIRVDPKGTAFQQRVWCAARKIPAGKVASYSAIAERIGNPTAYRAVAQALGHNPVVLAVPCHRVIGKNGTLTGFSAGLHRKDYLLAHEGSEIH